MAKQLPDEFLKQLRDVPIEEVAGHYLDLKAMGNIYQTNCIHKGDNSPSLTFFQQTNTFYCFGCGAGRKPVTEGSDVISFVMWIDKCTFTEAVTKIASIRGLTVPRTNLSADDKKKQELYHKMIATNRIYWEALQKEERGLQYLLDRGIEREDVDKWRLGYIPEDAKSIHKGKMVFALMNDWGQTVGFSHRDMTKEFRKEPMQGPKYVNSPKSLIFDKGSLLYGLNFVKKKIREKGYVIVGEGFGDAILGQKMGLPFVSVMGTSLTDQHINILKQYTNTIILWMDGDGGGINATIRHAKSLRKEGLIVKVLNYEGKDPDDIFMDMIAEFGYGEEGQVHAEDWVLGNAILATQFEIDQVLSSHESRITELEMQTMIRIQPILEQLDDGPEKAFMKKRVANRMNIQPRDMGWRLEDE